MKMLLYNQGMYRGMDGQLNGWMDMELERHINDHTFIVFLTCFSKCLKVQDLRKTSHPHETIQIWKLLEKDSALLLYSLFSLLTIIPTQTSVGLLGNRGVFERRICTVKHKHNQENYTRM